MGSGDQRATEAEINAMFRDQSFGIKTEQFIPMSNFDMVNSASLRSYRSYVKAYNPDRAYPELDNVSFCNKIKFLNDNGEISYSCLLMFGKGEYVQQFVPTFALSYLKIPGIDDIATEIAHYGEGGGYHRRGAGGKSVKSVGEIGTV